MITEIGLKVIKLREAGASIKRIEKLVGCSRSTVSKWCAMLRNNDEISAANLDRLLAPGRGIYTAPL